MQLSKRTFRMLLPLTTPRRALAVFRTKMKCVRVYESPTQKMLWCSTLAPPPAVLFTNARQTSESLPL
jgi:hypothetical protein